MKKGRGPCPGIGNPPLSGLPADPALAEGLGDDHASSGAQNRQVHITSHRRQTRRCTILLLRLRQKAPLLEGVPADSLFLIGRWKQLQEFVVVE